MTNHSVLSTNPITIRSDYHRALFRYGFKKAKDMTMYAVRQYSGRSDLQPADLDALAAEHDPPLPVTTYIALAYHKTWPETWPSAPVFRYRRGEKPKKLTKLEAAGIPSVRRFVVYMTEEQYRALDYWKQKFGHTSINDTAETLLVKAAQQAIERAKAA